MKTPTDKETADEIKKRFYSLALPLAGLIEECKRKGLNISFNIGLTADDEPDLKCTITKVVEL